jgi:hypothetical protein
MRLASRLSSSSSLSVTRITTIFVLASAGESNFFFIVDALPFIRGKSFDKFVDPWNKIFNKYVRLSMRDPSSTGGEVDIKQIGLIRNDVDVPLVMVAVDHESENAFIYPSPATSAPTPYGLQFAKSIDKSLHVVEWSVSFQKSPVVDWCLFRVRHWFDSLIVDSESTQHSQRRSHWDSRELSNSVF